MRDMDLIRELLLVLDRQTPPETGFVVLLASDEDFKSLKWSADVIAYHLRLLNDAGFIMTRSGHYSRFLGLSRQGHEFLDSIRDPKIWEKTKASATAAGGFTVDLLKDLAKGFIKKQAEEYTGVKL